MTEAVCGSDVKVAMDLCSLLSCMLEENGVVTFLACLVKACQAASSDLRIGGIRWGDDHSKT